MPMAIQFSILIMLHSALVLITTAEDYKCLPLVLRKTCCWINETYLARNVIIFASILINFLGAILNIVSNPNPSTLWLLAGREEWRVYEACSFLHGYHFPSCAWCSPELRDRTEMRPLSELCTLLVANCLFPSGGGHLLQKSSDTRKFLYYWWPINYNHESEFRLIKYLPAMCHALKEELYMFFLLIPHINPVR